ncbi:hypothetical protein NPIL_486661 [Nephila pilipes]|uniref:Uncharacterized protein n=1 Tax=Nephila pilipes TaxID=299642 RepID=A0A8X6MBH2_NEPPI|nr:hypothetical protein NPIL_486662 [Nephila pilipes]GFS38562.1 hypothetical protein NPIL_486661 [Nephila pilipes]
MNIKGNASHQFNSYQISLSCDNSIVYPHASSPASRNNSNVVDNDINSTYNDDTLIRRPARALDSSKNENSRSFEPAPIPSPKCALWYQNPKVIGMSSSHEKTDMPAQQNFYEGASASGCLLSSSGASASRGNTSIGDAPFRLCPRFTKFDSSSSSTILDDISSLIPRFGVSIGGSLSQPDESDTSSEYTTSSSTESEYTTSSSAESKYTTSSSAESDLSVPSVPDFSTGSTSSEYTTSSSGESGEFSTFSAPSDYSSSSSSQSGEYSTFSVPSDYSSSSSSYSAMRGLVRWRESSTKGTEVHLTPKESVAFRIT